MAPGSAEEQKNRALKETPGQRDQGKRGDPHTGNGAVEARQQGEVDAPKIQDGQDEVFRDKAVLFHHAVYPREQACSGTAQRSGAQKRGGGYRRKCRPIDVPPGTRAFASTQQLCDDD